MISQDSTPLVDLCLLLLLDHGFLRVLNDLTRCRSRKQKVDMGWSDFYFQTSYFPSILAILLPRGLKKIH